MATISQPPDLSNPAAAAAIVSGYPAGGYAGQDASSDVLIRDSSAAYDVAVGATSTTPLTAKRALTLDVDNGDRTLALKKNLTVQTGAVTLTGDAAGSTLVLPAGSATLGTMATQAASSVAITGGTAAGLTKAAVRDTSAAYDHVIASTSSVTATAERTTTLDTKNQDSTLDVPALAAAPAKLATLASGGWLDTVQNFILSIDPTITDIVNVPFGTAPSGAFGANITDIAANGGAKQPYNTANWLPITGPLVLNMGVTHWAVAAKVKMPAPESGKYGFVALYKDGTHFVAVEHGHTDSATKYILTSYDTSGSLIESTAAIDGGWHTCIFLFNGTNVRLFIDYGAAVATKTLNLPTTGAGCIYLRDNSAAGMPVSLIAVATAP